MVTVVIGKSDSETRIREQICVCCSTELKYSLWANPKPLNPWPFVSCHTVTVPQLKPCLMRILKRRGGMDIITCCNSKVREAATSLALVIVDIFDLMSLYKRSVLIEELQKLVGSHSPLPFFL